MKRLALAFALLLLTPTLYAEEIVYKFRLAVDGTVFSLTDPDSSGKWLPSYATTGAGGEVRFSDNAISAGNPRCLKSENGETVALQAKSYDTATLRCLETDCTVRADEGETIEAPRGKTIEIPSHAVLEIHLLYTSQND